MPLTSPPLAPSTLKALQSLNIRTHQDLQNTGVAKAFLLLKANGHTITRSVLWQLAALADPNCPPFLDESRKQTLLTQVRQHPPVAVFPPRAEMEYFMQQALHQARQAAAAGEVPVGAVVVRAGKIIAASHNLCISECNVSQHAEIRALAAAGTISQNYRLEDCDVYITLEPCPMCAGALLQARVRRVIFGASEPKSGAAGSVINLFSDRHFNQHTAVESGILADECLTLLQHFFQNKRKPV